MKIGILNMQYSRHNYGALLQAAALERMVRDILPEAEVEHIDFRPRWLRPVPRFKALGIWGKRLIRGALGRCIKMPMIGNYHVFEDFRREHIQLTERIYYEEEIEKGNWDYDLVVVGSDQVFRIKYVKRMAEAFFLTFLPDSCRRFAYAASFGVDRWESGDDAVFTSKVRVALEQFYSISVRE